MPLLKPDTADQIKSTFKQSSLILVYELLGTAMMTCLVVNYWNIKILTAYESASYKTDSNGNFELKDGEKVVNVLGTGKADNAGLLLGIFVTIMFSARISGSHFNPCITLAYMLGNVKQMKFDRVLGCLYIISQIAGSFLGQVFAAIFANGVPVKIQLNVEAGDIIQCCILEVMGSFFLVFMYLSSTEEKTKFTKDAAVQTIILAGSYLGAMLLAGNKILILHSSPVNPAIAFSTLWFNLDGGNFGSIWIFTAVSFGGSLLALVFFRKVYQTTVEAVDQIEEEEEHAQQDALLDE